MNKIVPRNTTSSEASVSHPRMEVDEDMQLQAFVGKVADRSVTVGIIGLGYVGIPLSLAIVDKGIKVVGFDVNPQRVSELNDGQSPIRHIPAADIARIRAQGFEATTQIARVAECDALIICVPTPLNRQREPDLSFVVATMDAIAPHLRAGHLVALESTTWPGTTDEVLAPYFERAGLTLGKDALLVYSPEREDPGNTH
jgi:UDP-N-acetyl-D-glucosamine dehydrogenase